jgi:hypothetical protein
MGVVVGYVCDQCPLAFEIGEYAYWDLTGSCTKAVCARCGVMHRLEKQRGAGRLLALPMPIRSLPLVTRLSAWGDGSEVTDYEWPYAENDWELIANFPVAPPLEQLACARCEASGQLKDELRSDENERCPVCQGSLASVYFDTVN